MLLIIGEAQTGKSVVCEKLVGRAFYQPTDVYQTGVNMEGQFGLSAFYDKFYWFMTEFRRKDNKNGGMSQAEFLNLVEGALVEIRRKYHTATNVLWKTPGMAVGNELNEWVDKKGSLSRRLFLVHFNRQLPARLRSDDLANNLTTTEVPACLIKCVHAYLSLLEHMRVHNIRAFQEILPEQVKRNIEMLKIAADVGNDFLNDPQNNLIFDHANSDPKRPILYMPWAVFLTNFQSWVQTKRKQAAAVVSLQRPEGWAALLSRNNVELDPGINVQGAKTVKKIYPRRGNKTQNALYLLNVDMDTNCNDIERDKFCDSPPPSESNQAPGFVSPQPSPRASASSAGAGGDIDDEAEPAAEPIAEPEPEPEPDQEQETPRGRTKPPEIQIRFKPQQPKEMTAKPYSELKSLVNKELQRVTESSGRRLPSSASIVELNNDLTSFIAVHQTRVIRLSEELEDYESKFSGQFTDNNNYADVRARPQAQQQQAAGEVVLSSYNTLRDEITGLLQGFPDNIENETAEYHDNLRARARHYIDHYRVEVAEITKLYRTFQAQFRTVLMPTASSNS